MPGPTVTSPYGNSGTNLQPPGGPAGPEVQPPVGAEPGTGDLSPGAGPMSSVAQATNAQAAAVPTGDVSQGGMAGPDQGGAAPDASGGKPDADLDQFLNNLGAQASPPDANGMSTQPEPEGLSSIKEQLNEATTRFKNAFTVTGKESVDTLKSSGLFTDVRDKDGEIQVQRKGRNGWESFDRKKFEVLGDAIDMSRDVFEGIVENAFRTAGGIGGAAAGTAAAPGPGTAVGAVEGVAAGGAAGALVAKNAGDIVAQQLLGIKRDPNRNDATEQATTAALGAGFSFLGSKIARSLANRSAVREEAKKTLDFASTQAMAAANDITQISKSGIKLHPDGKFRLDPQQLVGGGQIPEIDATAKELSTEQSFRNFRRDVTEHVVGAYDTVAKSLGAAAGKGADLGSDFVLTSQDVRNVEGKMIGAFRDQAENQLKGKTAPVPRLLQTVQFIKQNMPSAGYAERQLGLTPAQAKNYMREVDVMTRLLGRTGGEVRIDTAFALEKRLTQAINSNIDSANGRQYAIALLDLRNAIRDDGMDMMESAFKQMGGQAGGNKLLSMFQQSKARYSQIMDATRTLGKTLENENISRNALIGKLFEGKDSYKFARSAKTLIDETNPGLWNQLSGEYFQKLRTDATNPVTNAVDWGSMTKKWTNLDPRMQKDLLDSTGIPREGMDALMRLGVRIQGTTFEAMAKPPVQKLVKGVLKQIFVWWGGGAAAKGSAAGALLDGMGKDQAMAKWLQDGGLEEVLKEMPGMKPEKAAALRATINNWVPQPVRQGAEQLQRTRTRRKFESTVTNDL